MNEYYWYVQPPWGPLMGTPSAQRGATHHRPSARNYGRGKRRREQADNHRNNAEEVRSRARDLQPDGVHDRQQVRGEGARGGPGDADDQLDVAEHDRDGVGHGDQHERDEDETALVMIGVRRDALLQECAEREDVQRKHGAHRDHHHEGHHHGDGVARVVVQKDVPLGLLAEVQVTRHARGGVHDERNEHRNVHDALVTDHLPVLFQHPHFGPLLLHVLPLLLLQDLLVAENGIIGSP
eukprot:1184052-Prorocentrum_minimum.AAC.9